LEEKYEGIIQRTSSFSTTSYQNHNRASDTGNQGLQHRKARKKAEFTVESLALFSPQLVLQEDPLDDSQPSDVENNILPECESLTNTSSVDCALDRISMDDSGQVEGDEEATIGAIKLVESNQSVMNQSERHKDSTHSIDYDNTNSKPVSNYYGTPTFIDPESPQTIERPSDVYGSTTTMGHHLGDVTWQQYDHPDETTRLLGGGDKSSSSDSLLGSRNGEDLLRPSIFTTLGGLGAHNKFT
jgi:hypothetical protein